MMRFINRFSRILNLGVTTNLKKFKKEGGIIGENCEIQSQVEFGTEPYLITIGNHVRITQGVKFITHDGGVWVLRDEQGLSDIDVIGPIKVGNNVSIGWNAIIMPNVTIGDNCIIGAGAIVTKDIPSNTVAVGVPARVIESIDEYRSKVVEKGIHSKRMSKKEKKIFLKKLFESNSDKKIE